MGQADEISQFLQNKKEEKEEKEIDWETVKNEWLDNIDRLYDQIENWLEEAEKEGLVEIIRKSKDKEIHEEGMGRYKVSTLEIKLEDDTIKFIPQGRLTIGAKGRVDIRAKKGKFMIVKLDSEEHSGWYYVEKIKRGGIGTEIEYEKFDKELFTELFKQLVD